MFFEEWENNQIFSKSPSSAPSEFVLRLSVRTSQTSSTQQRPQTLAGPSCFETNSHSDGQQISHLWKSKVHDQVHNLLHRTLSTATQTEYPFTHPASLRYIPHFLHNYDSHVVSTLQFWNKILYLFLNSLCLTTNFPSIFRNTNVCYSIDKIIQVSRNKQCSNTTQSSGQNTTL